MLDHHRILAIVRNVLKILHKRLHMFTNLSQQSQVICLMCLKHTQLLVSVFVVV